MKTKILKLKTNLLLLLDYIFASKVSNDVGTIEKN